MSWLPALPVLFPLAGACACILAWRNLTAQRLFSLAAGIGQLSAAAFLLARVRREGLVVMQLGAWPAPFGISLVADLLAGILALTAAFMGVCIHVYALGSLGRRREAAGFHPLSQVLLAGVSGAFLAGDIFNLYVLFEVMLIASFALAAVGGDRFRTGGAVKYAVLNLFASFLFLMAVALLYRSAGTLNFAALARLSGEEGEMRRLLSLLFLAAFGIKAAVFPLFYWLPDSYPYQPVAIAALFAALLTKAGVYALIRVFTLLFPREAEDLSTLILTLAGFTMLTGVLGAAALKDIRKILSFHIISQIGYMILGLGLFTVAGLSGAIYFIVHNILAKANLFLVGGIARRMQGSYSLDRLGGLRDRSPALALLFLVSALSLAGIPPLSGFVGKLALARAGLESERYGVVAVALLVGLLTLFSMTKIWNGAFLKPYPSGGEAPEGMRRIPRAARAALWSPVAILAAATVAIGVGAEPCLELTRAAAEQLLDREVYIRAVLGAP